MSEEHVKLIFMFLAGVGVGAAIVWGALLCAIMRKLTREEQ